MTEEIKSDEETEVRNFPKIDRSRLYSIIIVIFLIISIPISIMINQFWITLFVIIPFLMLLKREKP